MSPWPTCAVPARRVALTALMPGLGAVWRSLVRSEKLESFREQGILPSSAGAAPRASCAIGMRLS